MFRLSFVVAFVLAVLPTGAAHATPRSFALLVGANRGEPYELGLHYAESETRRLGEVLQTMGDFAPADVVTLAHPTVTELRHAFDGVRARLAAVPGESLVVVFYSGHADAEGLHLGGERFPLDELRDTVAAIPASARVLVVDACRSGSLTRVKGGRPGPSFAVHLDAPIGARGLAILTSSAADENSQESDEVGSSLFTHFLTSALMGAGDKNDDGAVTIEEAFAYASERTIVATTATQMGPQHPTFRYELGGRGGLVLTRPGRLTARLGLFQFPEPGWYLVRREDGPIVAELHSARGGQKLALEAGHYRLSKRLHDFYLEGALDITPGATASFSTAHMRRYDYPRGLAKGGYPDLGLLVATDDAPSRTPLYRRWWVWTATAGVAAVVAGAIVVGVVESRPREATLQVHQP
ncbi:MAG TPA: caspase family protein [Polyangia bacterium]|nr:caspase family protein [Polyangia bacterium]